MKTILALWFCLMLSACAIAIHDPSEFENRATHQEKIYAVPMNDLYGCFMKDIFLGSQISTWKSENEAYYGLSGVFKITMKPLTSNKTRVRMSSISSTYASAFKDWFHKLEGCTII